MGATDVSVIVPTHRRERLVLNAIASALSQPGVSLEVIVLDDTQEGSARDAVGTIHDSRLAYVHRESPSGGRPALVRNEGIQRAEGRFLHFLDDDDELTEGAVASLVRSMESRPDCGMSFGRVEPVGDDVELVSRERTYFERSAASARSGTGSRTKLSRQILFGTAPFITSACLVRTEVARGIGGFDTTLAVAEDTEFFLRVVRSYGATFVDRSVLLHRVGQDSLSRNAGPDVWMEAYRAIHEMYRSRFGSFEFYALQTWARVERALEAVIPTPPTA